MDPLLEIVRIWRQEKSLTHLLSAGIRVSDIAESYSLLRSFEGRERREAYRFLREIEAELKEKLKALREEKRALVEQARLRQLRKNACTAYYKQSRIRPAISE